MKIRYRTTKVGKQSTQARGMARAFPSYVAGRLPQVIVEPNHAVPPGETLREVLDALGMDQRELAMRTGLSTKTVSEIMNGKAPISQETALHLERVTGVDADFWTERERIYQARRARMRQRESLRTDLAWVKEVPWRELARRGAIPLRNGKEGLVEALLRFFGVASVSAWREVWQPGEVAQLRDSAASPWSLGALAAWIRLGELQARRLSCEPFDREDFRRALGEIRSLTREPPPVAVRQAQERCARAGVAFVVVQGITGAPVWGATRWLSRDKVMIEMSLRFKREDHFWFSFFHEAAHVLFDGKKDRAYDWKSPGGKADARIDPREKRADAFAARFLIPDAYRSRLSGLKSRTAVEDVAKAIGIAPGILVGRLQRDGVLSFKELNDLRRLVSIEGDSGDPAPRAVCASPRTGV